MDLKAKIYVAGHTGMVGSAIIRALRAQGATNIVTRTRDQLDLIDQAQVRAFFASTPVDLVFLAAAKVGGIAANARAQADFLYENLMMSANVIHSAASHGVKKLLFLGSSCIYPKVTSQPIPESALLTGELEPTNEGYALAKIAGVKLCEKYRMQYGRSFISAMPTNLYGPGDNFHPAESHVAAALMRRFHEAKLRGDGKVSVWGTGKPRRELLHVDDLAAACLVLMEKYEGTEPINVGTGQDCTIDELARTIRTIVGGRFELEYDTSKPDGTPAKRLDVSRIQALGWRATIGLERGLAETYAWALANHAFR